MRERNIFSRQREEKPYPLNSFVKASKLLCLGHIEYWNYAIDAQLKEKIKQKISL